MALNDVYEVRVGGVHTGGQDWNLVKHYQQDIAGSPVGDASVLWQLYASFFTTVFADAMSDNWNINLLAVVNLGNPSDYDETAYFTTGDLSDPGLPPVLAVGFRSPRQDIGHNRGRHQMPLGHAGWLANDGSLSATALDACYFIQQLLGSPALDTVSGAQWTPVTVKKTYVDSVLIDVEVRSEVAGQWTVNRWFTTSKARQSYDWQLAEEPE